MILRHTRLTKKIAHLAGDAIEKYGMIRNGDRIIVAVSGGKDSMSMIHFLKLFQTVAPVKFDIFPVYIDPGFTPSFSGELTRYLDKKAVQIHCEKTDYGITAHSPENTVNPCFLCARMRRKRLFELAEERDCYKIALGHTRDDIIETLFINMCYKGEMSAMMPSQPMFKEKFTIIRPLAFVDEAQTNAFREQAGIPNFINPCPSAANTKRSQLKKYLNSLYELDPGIKTNVFKAMSRIKTDYMPEHT